MPHLKLTNIPKWLNFDDEDYALDASGKPAFSPLDARDILNVRSTISYEAGENASTGVKGNVQVSFNLGSARHRCLGTIQDKKYRTILYFLWASDGNHKIMRYHRTKTDSANPYGIIEKVIEYNFRWTQRTKITGVDLVQDNDSDLLYWTDNIGPRKVNLAKASILNKQRSWSLYIPKSELFENGTGLTIIEARDINNVLITDPTIQTSFASYVPIGSSNSTALDQIVSEGNAPEGILTFKGCDCHIEVSTSDSRVQRISFVINGVSVSYPTLVVPENWYGADLNDRMFDQGKYPPSAPPEIQFIQDDTKNFNKVKNIPWQFRNYYHYDDFETSVLGAISLIPIDNIVCNAVLNERLNCIDINFNDASLLDPKTLVILKEVSVCFRQTNEGIWKQVEKIKICDFFDIDSNNNPIAHYRFYNNVTPKVIPEQEVTHQYDRLPEVSSAQRFLNNRLVHAGITEGKDKPDCVNMELAPIVSDDPTPETFEVTFAIRILSQMLDDDPGIALSRAVVPSFGERRGAIMHNKGRETLDFPFFGGFHFGHDAGDDPYLVSNMEGRFEQNLPEGGWLCYAAGTDYRGISKQIDIGLSTTSNGALIIGEGGEVKDALLNKIGAYLKSHNTSPLRDLYSLVTIRVPKGDYIFRLASHHCSYGDKLQKGKMFDLNNGRLCYQTSTNVFGVIKYPSGQWMPDFEIPVSVNGADVHAGEFIVYDQSYPTVDEESMESPITGYLYDANGSVDEDDIRKNGIPVTRALMSSLKPSTQSQSIIEEIPSSSNERNRCFTDHNGYFYLSREGDDWALRAWQVNDPTGLSNAKLITYAESSDTTGWNAQVFDVRAGTPAYKLPRSLQDLHDKQMQAAPEDLADDALNQFLLCTSTPNARLQCSTYVEGSFVDQNNIPISGAQVLLQGGGESISDENGRFKFVAWGDMIGRFSKLPENNNNRFAILHYFLPAHCRASYIGGATVGVALVNITAFGDNLGTTSPPYSPTATYNFDTINGTPFAITANQPIIFKSRKRGGNYRAGIIYFDDLLRQTTVAFNEESKVYIPFTTEDLSKYIPSEPVGTYRRGIAQIFWSLTHKPPKNATRYAPVLVRDSIHESYLTWVINEVKYIIAGETLTVDGVQTFDYTETNFQNQKANFIMLDISNIATYARKNFDTRISYQFKKGDRIRLLADDTKTGLQGLFDYEIVSFEQPGWLIIKNSYSLGEIKAGFEVQVYSPKDLNAEELFFEIGEFYPCTAPGTDANDHSVLAGIFRGGDTYFRHRSIPVYNDDKNIATVVEYFMECSSISDVYDSDDADIGRPHVHDDSVRQMDRPALRRVSDGYVPNTKINGLCRWREANYSELDRKDGRIIDLKDVGNILLCTQEHGIISTYIHRVEMRNTDGSTNLIYSKEYFGTDNRMQQDYGAQFAGGIVQREDFVYGADLIKGLSWRRANNGLFAISEYKARNYWGRYRGVPIWDVVAVFDGAHKEAIFTIWKKQEVSIPVISVVAGDQLILEFSSLPDVQISDEVEITFLDKTTNINTTISATVTDNTLQTNNGFGIQLDLDWTYSNQVIVGDSVKFGYRGEADTIAFSEPDNRWVHRYSFAAEAYESIGDEFVSIKDGSLWIHDKNDLRNNFYGQQFPHRIKTIFNAHQEVKMWLAAFLDSTQDNASNDWSCPVVSNKNGQLSRIEKASFVKKEQYWHSEFYKDLNTAGKSNPIQNGRYMRSSAITVELENDYTGEVLLRTISALFEVSERNTK